MKFPTLARMAVKSACNRRATLSLLVASIALSTVLLLGVERAWVQAREGFSQAISGTDLIVSAHGSGLELLLYSVFHLGSATSNMKHHSAQTISSWPEIEWAVPISLGDSHKGHPVVATTANYFSHRHHRRDKGVAFKHGDIFDDVFDIVLGHEVAEKLDYPVGKKITLTHRADSKAHTIHHDDKPFTVVGVLEPTGTPIDRSLFISLHARTALHLNWSADGPISGVVISPERARKCNLEPKRVTALLLGLKKRSAVPTIQRRIAEYTNEPLQAVIPGVSLNKLWRLVNVEEQILTCLSLLVLVAGLAGLAASILVELEQRRRELAILRALGAGPRDIVTLVIMESLVVTILGIVCGVIALACLIEFGGGIVQELYGIVVTLSLPTVREWAIVGIILTAGFLAGLIPARKAYKMTLADGLNWNL